MKRLFVIALCAFCVAAATPAFGQTGPSANLSGVTANSTVTGYVGLGAQGSAAGGVKRLEIQINGSVVRYQEYGGIQQNASIDFTWDSRRYNNAAYVLKARTVSNSGAQAASEVRVLVNNPASTPTGVAASYTGAGVAVSWSANPESDITEYRVERSSGGGWTQIGTPSATSLADHPGPGQHSYRVTAVRYSPVGGGTASAPSAPAEVAVPQPSSGTAAGSGGSSGGSTKGSVKGDGGRAGGGGSKAGPGSNRDRSSGGRKGKKGGPGGGFSYGGFGYAGGRRLGALGLPGRLRLPGRIGAARAEAAGLPVGGDRPEWGTFQETLPYDLPDSVGITERVGGGLKRVAALSPTRLIPPDGLRWIAAGLWLLVTSLLLLTLARRLAEQEERTSVALDLGTSPRRHAAGPPISAASRVLVIPESADVVAANMAPIAPRDIVAENLSAGIVDRVAENIAATHRRAAPPPQEVPARGHAPATGPRARTSSTRSARTATVKKTARKKTARKKPAAQRAALPAIASANDPAKPSRSRRSAKTTTARKSTPAGQRRRSGAKKTVSKKAA